MSKYAKMLIILIASSLLQAVFADNSIKMLVKFNVSKSKLLSYAALGNINMSCSGMTSTNYPYGYSITGSYLDSKGLEIGVDGPFPDDKRKTCKLDDQTTGNTNDVYFAVESLPIYFTYDGTRHSCYVNQQIGTSWNNANRKNNKLQGQITETDLPCNGLIDGDTYRVNHGSGNDKGNITINVLEFATISMYVYIDTPLIPANSVTSISLGESYSMPCAGRYNYYSILGAEESSDHKLKIRVGGPFNGDPRDTCQIYDQHTGNTNNVYFAVESLPIFFTYNGVQHSCYINQKVGTSYDHYSYIRDLGFSGVFSYAKLQGENTGTSIPCNGLVYGDNYQITAGYDQITYQFTGGIHIKPFTN